MRAVSASESGSYRLKRLESSYVPRLQALVHSTINVSYSPVYPQEAIDYFKEHHSEESILKDAEEGYTVVLEVDGEIVGTGTIVGNHIKRVFVNPAFQKRGLGKIIMRNLEEEARSRGVERIEFDASLPSKRFYDSLGYATVEETFLTVANDKRLDYYRMEKLLGERPGTNGAT